ncbi:hypothetical protein E5K00_00535 [Hymenobacter aquaticus]|uniref:Gluconolaconase n=1 Tax=Hymenobacter aquaticus TaxID=1867101 RepID=A0A4Z0Q297_9BACT|nr:SMP-30/gluconolactonase/LRE family protein [Hymenobacter aquaticus]TGE23734.1 hypothetical protein E5K00_00535 [Hymenobacter aquaticus]
MTSFRLKPRGARQFTMMMGLLVGSVSLSACFNNDVEPTLAPPPGADLVTFTKENLYPEGIDYDTNGRRFLVSSLTTGIISQVADDGSYAPFVTDASLVSSVGLHIDAERNRLLVAVSDPGYNKDKTTAATKGKLAALASYDGFGKRVGYVDLGSLRPALSHFANDMAVDQAGNVYVTDSFAPIIYKVDVAGVASVFLEDARLGAPAGQFGLNGIEVHPDGYLLVAKTDDGSLFKVPLSNPTAFTKVGSSQDLKGIDGLTLIEAGRLYASCNSQSKVYNLTTANGWGDVTVAGTFATLPEYPTTLARRSATETYVLYSRINELQTPATPAATKFNIAKLKF